MMEEKLFKELNMMFVKFTMPAKHKIEKFVFDHEFNLISHEFREVDKDDETHEKGEGNGKKNL